MEAEDPLSQLRDIHLPDPVAYWPPAPGWWVLLLLVLIALGFAWRHAILAMIRRRKLARVLAELDTAFEEFSEKAAFDNLRNEAGLEFLARVNTLLKRVAQVTAPHAGTAELTGSAWLQYLDACDNTTEFSRGAGTALGDGLYRRSFDADADALRTLARHWIENRYREKPAAGSSIPATTDATEVSA